jgi:hypothetical protein
MGDAFEQHGGQVVVKPRFGGGGYGVLVLGPENAPRALHMQADAGVADWLQEGMEVVVQPYEPGMAQSEYRFWVVQGGDGGATPKVVIQTWTHMVNGEVDGDLVAHLKHNAKRTDAKKRKLNFSDEVIAEVSEAAIGVARALGRSLGQGGGWGSVEPYRVDMVRLVLPDGREVVRLQEVEAVFSGELLMGDMTVAGDNTPVARGVRGLHLALARVVASRS